jgi:putative uridylyltransferase
MGHLKNALRAILPNPFVSILKKLKQDPHLLFFWNRGLGDIPLELYPLITLLLTHKPQAKLTIITREDLYQGFELLDFPITLLKTNLLARKQPENYEAILKSLNLDPLAFDHIVYKPDPAYWAKKHKKGLICKLRWLDRFTQPIHLDTSQKIAVLHIHSETVYGFEKNLPKTTWDAVIQELRIQGYYTVCVGFSKDSGHFQVDLDLRGKTDLHEFISLMIKHNPIFIGPDSGLLNMLYYLDVQKPWHLISFWANPRVGLLNQATASPNKLLNNDIILAPNEDLSQLKAQDITRYLPQVDASDLIPLDQTSSIESLVPRDVIYQARHKLASLSHAKENACANLSNPECELISRHDQDDRIIPIILAGGQGTRLQFSKPKALFEVNHLSLLGHFAGKIKQASLLFKKPLQAIIITSQEGHEAITRHLEENEFFGLLPSQLLVITQENLPFTNQENQLVLKNEKTLYEGPNGNGDVFKLISKHSIFDKLDSSVLGFEIIPIDNPLAPLFSSHHVKSFLNGYEASLLAIQADESEKTLGKLALSNQRICIIEYTNHPPEDLKLCNTGLLGFSLEFAKRCAQRNLPVHTAWKAYPCFNGKEFQTMKIKKFETFIFDHLDWASHVKVYVAARKDIFQPLKEVSGPYGIDALEKALGLQEIELL